MFNFNQCFKKLHYRYLIYRICKQIPDVESIHLKKSIVTIWIKPQTDASQLKYICQNLNLRLLQINYQQNLYYQREYYYHQKLIAKTAKKTIFNWV